MKCKLISDNTDLGLISGEEGFGIETGTPSGDGYTVVFPANDDHSPITLFFLNDDASIEITDSSTAGEDVYYSL